MPHLDDRPRLSRDEAIRRTLARDPRECAFLFDFDGTLAPIVDRAEDALPAAEATAALGELRRTGARVGIVSARPVSFLARHVDLPGVSLCGVYGLEVRTSAGATRVNPQAAAWVPVVARVRAAAQRELGPEGVDVEDKYLAVALHFRSAPHLAERVESWTAATAAATGLAVQRGRMVLELRPPLDRDKGSIIAENIHDVRCAWYFGDDRADIAAFEALRRHRATGGNGGFLPVAVAVDNPEGGGDVAAAADFTLGTPHDVIKLVFELAGGWGTGGSGTGGS